MISAQRHRSRNSGFTLLEMAVVVLIIAIVSAVSLPYLMPAILFSELEGAARHLTNYGRSAMSESTLYRETFTVYFDLDNQEYYVTHLIYPDLMDEKSEEGVEGEVEEINQLALLSGMGSTERTAEEVNKALEDVRAGNTVDQGALPEGFDNDAASEQMRNRFAWFSRQLLEIRADNVKHGEEFLEDAGNLFDDYEFDLETPEPEEVELKTPLLGRVRFPDGVRLTEVVIGEHNQQWGEVMVTISPLGLEEPVTLYLQGGEEEYYTIFWNPVTAEAQYYVGYYDVNELL